MKHLRLAGLGVILIVLVTALFTACSSDDEQAQQQQQQSAGSTAQSEEAEEAQQTESAAQSSRADQTAQEQADEQESSSTATTTATTDSDAEQSEPQQSVQQQSQQTTVSVSAEQAEQEQPAAEDEAGADDAEDAQPADEDEAEAVQQEEMEPEQQEAEDSDEPGSDDQQHQMEPEQQEQSEEQQAQAQAAERERLELRAEEIRAQATVTDLVGLNGWLNGEETTIALELAKGNIVLVDFWTYTCINCVRTLPFLTAWDEKYREHGLVILGVHTPEFEFEKVPDNIRQAIAEYNIKYDVPIDNDYRTWRAFSNRYWPAKYLIGPTDDGSPMGVRYFHFGEGHYEESEREIRAALEAVGRDLSDVPFGVDVSVPTRQAGVPRQTRELYMGWRRNVGSGGPYAGQESYFLAGTDIDTLYHDVELSDREHNRWYLEGLWRTEGEAIIHARETENLEDYVALVVRGRTTNVVLTVAEDNEPFDVYIELDGRWLAFEEAGEHINWDEQGRSYIRVVENDLYRLLNLPEWSEHELKLRSDSDQFRIFAFTFGSYVGGE